MGRTVVFRDLQRDDFPLLARWLAEPQVARWWNHAYDEESLEKDFGAAVDGTDPTRLLLAHVDSLEGMPFGLLQHYRFDSYPEYGVELGPLLSVPAGALSIDYLIGESSCRGMGLGAEMIRAGVSDGWAGHPGSDDVIVPVAAGNHASRRALLRAGFREIAWGPLEPDNPIDPPEHVVHGIRRPGLSSRTPTSAASGSRPR
ncbi:GNAT family N-acetyltransferase [Nakamurella sp. YIM 132087]|uniref:Lysine N-acyltransferase MbtK n=1 Tax=Nakamurella alba TaxID=2665158 RepID=A0A7K1FGL8_9ACTN|nr:GNAT family N-acetyltransferase [Nakamurella alba]MTD13261.1 GNAT family N-acetyltransferase [Nakamurella alba]